MRLINSSIAVVINVVITNFFCTRVNTGITVIAITRCGNQLVGRVIIRLLATAHITHPIAVFITIRIMIPSFCGVNSIIIVFTVNLVGKEHEQLLVVAIRRLRATVYRISSRTIPVAVRIVVPNITYRNTGIVVVAVNLVGKEHERLLVVASHRLRAAVHRIGSRTVTVEVSIVVPKVAYRDAGIVVVTVNIIGKEHERLLVVAVCRLRATAHSINSRTVAIIVSIVEPKVAHGNIGVVIVTVLYYCCKVVCCVSVVRNTDTVAKGLDVMKYRIHISIFVTIIIITARPYICNHYIAWVDSTASRGSIRNMYMVGAGSKEFEGIGTVFRISNGLHRIQYIILIVKYVITTNTCAGMKLE